MPELIHNNKFINRNGPNALVVFLLLNFGGV